MAKQIPISDEAAILAYKNSAQARQNVNYGDANHGKFCDAKVCRFWKVGKTNVFVCMRSASHVHRCGEECKAMICQSHGFVCPFTGITSNDYVYSFWGVDQVETIHPPPVKRRRLLSVQDQYQVIRSQIQQTVHLYLDDTKERREFTRCRRYSDVFRVIYDVSQTSKSYSLSEVLDLGSESLKLLTKPAILNPEREKWLVDTITDFFVRLDFILYSAKKKINAFTATCILHLGTGEKDKYSVEMFPFVPWLKHALRPIEIGRIGKLVRCGAEEKMWASICAHISIGNSVKDKYTFMQPNTLPIPK